MAQRSSTAALHRSMGAAAPWLTPALASFVALAALLWSLPRGLDLSDEGYYLTEIAHPGDTTATALLFGWIWHPAYAVTGGSVTALRLVGFALVAALAVALTMTVVRLGPAGSRPGRVPLACLCAVTTALAFAPLSVLPATPSYNTLSWMSLAMAALGCALAWNGRRPLVGGALVGLAGFVAVTAKPTTALVLLAGVVVTTPWRRTGVRSVLAAAAALVVPSLVLVLMAPGQLDGLVEVVRRGVDATVGHTSLVRRDPYSYPVQVLVPLAVAGLGGVAAGLVQRRGNTVVTGLLGSVSVAVAAGSLAFWWRSGRITGVDLMLPSGALTGFTVLCVAAVAVAWRRAGDARPGSGAVRLAVLLALLPAAYAFGTNNNLWHWAGQTVVFWLLAVVLLVGTDGPVAGAAGALAAYVALVSAVITPLDPYRGGPLFHTGVTRVSLSGATLRLPPEEARVTNEMLAVGRRLGVDRETRVLDLTGASPGVVWAWGARPLASGWVIGGYPESLLAARTAIGPARCDLPGTLVLWSPQQRRAIPDHVLEPWSVRLPDDYRAVATFPRTTVPPTAGQPAATVETVTVLEPMTVSVPGCPDS